MCDVELLSVDFLLEVDIRCELEVLLVMLQIVGGSVDEL